MRNANGRGATTRIHSNRFRLPERQADGDWLDWAEWEDELPPLRTTVQTEFPKTALTRNDSPDIPFDRSFNAYRGCEHGCIYCFARPTHAWHDLSPGLDFETRLFAKPTGPALLRQEFARAGYHPQVLAMGTNTDPYQPIERQYCITRQVLDLCLECRHPVSITTKSDCVLRDLDLLQALAARQLVVVMLSVTTLDRHLARVMEPRAATPTRRLRAVRQLAAAGVPALVSVAPVIPALTDHELEAIVAAAAQSGASAVFAAPVRLPYEVAQLFEAWLRTHFPDRADHVLSAIRAMRGGRLNQSGWFQRRAMGGEWGRVMTQRLQLARKRHGIAGHAPALRTDLFRKPPGVNAQGELF